MQQMTTQARPYARAAFAFAQQHNIAEAWMELLHDMGLLVKDDRVANYLANPKVSPIAALQLFKDIFTKQIDTHLQNFLCLLAQARQLLLLPEIARLFAEYATEYLQTETVRVLAAKVLSTAQQEKLNAALSKRLQKKVQLNCTVDPELIGGVIIRTEKWMLDSSVKWQLKQLKTKLVG